jgi:hypothetical protein
MLRVADIAGRRDDDFRYGDEWSPQARFATCWALTR